MIFPFLDGGAAEVKTQIIKEYAWDFERNDFKFRDGKTYIVEGIEALKIWIYKTLKTPRYEHSAYSWEYGSEFNELFGKKLSKPAADEKMKQLLQEALLVNTSILAVREVATILIHNKLEVSFIVETVFGEVDISVYRGLRCY